MEKLSSNTSVKKNKSITLKMTQLAAPNNILNIIFYFRKTRRCAACLCKESDLLCSQAQSEVDFKIS